MAITLTYPDGGILVTGGTGTVGTGVVRALADAGVPLLFTYHSDRERADALVREWADKGARIAATQLDMRDEAAVRATVALAERTLGGLHGVAHAGGPLVRFDTMADLSPDIAARFFDADAMGILRLFQAAIPLLRERGGGSLLTCTTMATQKYIAYDGLSPFSKGAVDALVRYVAAEEIRHNIRCNAVGIGWVTDRAMEDIARDNPQVPAEILTERDRLTAIYHQVMTGLRAPRPVDPLEAGMTYAFLASDQARHLNGQFLYLDGGILL
ncbi:SDR family oxidoreductase [Sphingobium sp. Sx8-8]|uniref:SDR family NAD(P)-dependent oxidoreductase n=1 Tax=Sphingobium sp. Sx8-8 TaxID=2933617 RepID=UPI001F5708EA|nr:SDR family oxidoreductase [Sphingobium sp. Sx8-8]